MNKRLLFGMLGANLLLTLALLVLVVVLLVKMGNTPREMRLSFGPAPEQLLEAQKEADVNVAKAQIGLFKGALERYALDMKDFPTTEQGLKALCEKPSQSPGSSGGRGSRSDSRADTRSDAGKGENSGGSKWDGPYLNSTSAPKDPWGHEYQYAYTPTRGKGNSPDIWSFGPDGKGGTADDVAVTSQ